MIWFTAQMASTDPNYFGYLEHGVRYFEKTILAEDGLPKMRFGLDGSDKTQIQNAYFLAFAIFALTNAFAVLRDERILGWAIAIFKKLERSHHEPKVWGYFDSTASASIRDQNPNLHVLEAYIDLYRVWPEPEVRTRLDEQIRFFTDCLMTADGYLADHIDANGSGADGRVNIGHDLEVAHLLTSAEHALGLTPNLDAATKLVEHSLNHGWDGKNGGFWAWRFPDETIDTDKIWWVQMEGLLSLITLFAETREPHYFKFAWKQWEWIRDHQIDPEYPGIFPTLTESGNLIEGQTDKGHGWKAAYHDGRTMLLVPRLLRNLT